MPQRRELDDAVRRRLPGRHRLHHVAFYRRVVLEPELLTGGKIGTLLGSFIGAALGMGVLLYSLRSSDRR